MICALAVVVSITAIEIRQPIRGGPTKDEKGVTSLALEVRVRSPKALTDSADFHFRLARDASYQTVKFVRKSSALGFSGMLQEYRDQIEYFLVLHAKDGESVTVGSPEAPLLLETSRLVPLRGGKGLLTKIVGGAAVVGAAMVGAFTGTAAAPPDDSAGLGGSWSGPRGTLQTAVVLSESGENLTGRYTDDQGGDGAVSGWVRGRDVSFSVAPASGTVFTFEGTRDADGTVLTGRSLQEGAAPVEWILRRQTQ